MGGGDDQAAACEVIVHHTRKQALPGGIEGVGRLIQQPDRPPHRQQPGDREPAPLSGREIRRRQPGGMIEPHRGQALRGIERLAAQEIPPECEVFQHTQRRFERIAVAEVMRLFGQVQLRFAPLKINGTPGETETPTWLPNATHSVLVVNEESAIASPDPQPEPAEEGEAATQADDEDEAPLREAVTREAPGVKMEEENVLASEAPEYESPPPWSIEAISICFAMDVPRTALLVTPAAHPIHRFIKELNGYGVDARPLDMLSPVAVKMSIPNDKCTETTAHGESPDPPSQTHEVSISRTFPTSS